MVCNLVFEDEDGAILLIFICLSVCVMSGSKLDITSK